MRTALVLPILILAASCVRSSPECAKSVEQFRATLRFDPTLATAPESAIETARAHRGEKSSACVLANGFADDAEFARRNAAASPAPTTTVRTGIPQSDPDATPRVHFEITPPAHTESTPSVRPGPAGGPAPVTPVLGASPATGGPAAATSSTPDDVRPSETAAGSASAACRKECESTAYPLARTACEQRCDGATPLPGASAAPVIVH